MQPRETETPEPRWPAVLAMLAIGGLAFALPEHLTLGPNWLLLVLLLPLLGPALWAHARGSHKTNHAIGVAMSAVVTVALVYSIVALIATLGQHLQTASGLLLSAGVLWLCDVLVFATWYWRLDAGGPHARDKRAGHADGAFLFPQMTLKGGERWKPGFVDYLHLAFNTSTAFSPTDVAPLRPWAKLLMMGQSLLSLATVVVLAARAVNML